MSRDICQRRQTLWVTVLRILRITACISVRVEEEGELDVHSIA
jgi:hypothetical protein